MKDSDGKKPRDYGADRAIDNAALSGEATGLIPAPPPDGGLDSYSELSGIVKRKNAPGRGK